jgi:hypothetical protein
MTSKSVQKRLAVQTGAINAATVLDLASIHDAAGEARTAEVLRALLRERSELMRALENLTEVAGSYMPGDRPAITHAQAVLRSIRGY